MIEQQLQETLAHIRRQTKLAPQLGFVLGSGLASFADHVEAEAKIPFRELPHFATTTVEGHPGQLVLGHLEGVPVAVLQGRLHAYEGLSFEKVMYPVRTLAALGIKTLLVTNAAGGLKASMKPGDFMIIRDHINLCGENPLRGPNWSYGPRFVDMTDAYDSQLSKILKASFVQEKTRVHEGVYVGVMGPTFETAAEIKFYGKIGGGSVGMSTVSDVIAARHTQIKVCGVSCITNLGTGLSKSKLSHDDVKDVAGKVEKKFAKSLVTFVKKAKHLL